MGGANFMGNDKGMPDSKGQNAFECFLLWIFAGLFISLLLKHLILPRASVLFAFPFYIVVGIILFIWYWKKEGENE